MSQYAHSVSANLNGSVSLYFAPHDDIGVAIFQSNKNHGSWTSIDFANLDAAEKVATDMLAAIKRRREQSPAVEAVTQIMQPTTAVDESIFEASLS